MTNFLSGNKIVAFAGGVGGSRLARGMAQHLTAEQLTIIVNTGDDFEHLGLKISPDLDTMLYNLSDVAHPEKGWGIHNDTSNVMAAIKQLGGPTWFHLGDRDLATHLVRTQLLLEGKTLTEVAQYLCAKMEIPFSILPMADEPCRTMVETDEGILSFQDYFVRHQWQPKLTGIHWKGTTQPTPQVIAAIQAADVAVICPSNPFVSIDPILGLRGVREALQHLPVVAMSPIIGGMAVKGPAAKMFLELTGKPASVQAVVDFYGDLLDGMVIDEADAEQLTNLQQSVAHVAAMPTLMLNRKKQIQVAAAFLRFVQTMLEG
ncbi:MAG: 2-phospho-L-lactate transferase [Anaerolineae bacterium]|jgi:LPPG:FO 2-phospho-L-lactate transferase|nr:2-phospho-L-lactate transferase [Anaerolineae bacterium]